MVARRGFSLIEVIVALTLLSVGMLAVAGSGLLAARLLNDAEAQEALTARVQSILDSLIINDITGSGRIVERTARVDWDAGATRVRILAQRPDGTRLELEAAR